jgi:hypothetical protein
MPNANLTDTEFFQMLVQILRISVNPISTGLLQFALAVAAKSRAVEPPCARHW